MASNDYFWQDLQPSLVFNTQEAKIIDNYLNLDLNLDQFQSYRDQIGITTQLSFFGTESGTSEHSGCNSDQGESQWLNSPSSSEFSSLDYCHLSPHSRERTPSSLSGEVQYLNINSPDNIMSGRSSLNNEHHSELDCQLDRNQYCQLSTEVEMPESIYQDCSPVFNDLSHPCSSGFVSDSTQYQVINLSDSTLEHNGAYSSSDSFSPASTNSHYSPSEFGEWNNTSSIGNELCVGSNIFTSPNGKVYVNSAPSSKNKINNCSSNKEDLEAIPERSKMNCPSLSSESQDVPKKIRRENRKTKVFYDSLTAEERKMRDKEMEKERARKYRRKEKDRLQKITTTVQAEEELKRRLTEEIFRLTSQMNRYKHFLRNKNVL